MMVLTQIEVGAVAYHPDISQLCYFIPAVL